MKAHDIITTEMYKVKTERDAIAKRVEKHQLELEKEVAELATFNKTLADLTLADNALQGGQGNREATDGES